MAVVMTVMPGVPVRIWMSVPRRVLVCGIAVAIRLTLPGDIAAVPLAAATGHFDNVQHSWGAWLRNGRTGIGRHRGGAQNQGTEQGQNCCTHRSRPSALLLHDPGRIPGCRRGEAICPVYQGYVPRRLALYSRCRAGVICVVGLSSSPMLSGTKLFLITYDSPPI